MATKTANDTIGRYFRTIDAALDGLDIYLADEDSPLYHHELTGSILAPLYRATPSLLRCLGEPCCFCRAVPHQPWRKRLSALSSMCLIWRGTRRTAEKRIAEMPDADTLRLEMVDYILLKKKFPVADERRNGGAALFGRGACRVTFSHPSSCPKRSEVSVNPKNGRPYYVVHWGAFDGTANLPLVYIAVIEDSIAGNGQSTD